MKYESKAIVLNYIKHGETSIITKVFTREFGVQSFIVKGVRSKKSRKKINVFQPLQLILISANFNRKKSLQQLNDVSLDSSSIVGITIKSQLLCMFIAEVIIKITRTDLVEKDLFDYIWFVRKNMSINNPLNNNFGVVFLIKLSEILGFGPLKKSISNSYFHLELGEFVDFYNKEEGMLDRFSSNVLKKLLVNNNVETTYEERKTVLDDIILYFKFHNYELKNLTSHLIIESLRE